MTRPGTAPDLMVGGFVLLLGVLALWQTSTIPASPIYAQVGPKAVPYVVGAGLLSAGRRGPSCRGWRAGRSG